MATSNDEVEESSISADSWCVTNRTTCNISFLWTIKNYSYCNEYVELIESSTFPTNMSKGSRWVMKLFPRGIPFARSLDCTGMSAFLKLVKSSAEEIKAKFKISIITNDGGKLSNIVREGTKKFTESISHGFDQFISIKYLFDHKNILLLDDTLKLYCEITIMHELVNVSSNEIKSDLVESSTSTLLEDFGHLLEESPLSDVILNVKGKQISAHKSILSARSPVFEAMFKYEMKESTLNEVDITDISHETMKNVLIFIYTGKTPNLETMADSLLSSADKYGLEQLKRLCEELLKSTITIENSCHLLLLADMHNANHLKSCAIHFINAHGSSVIKTDGWRNIAIRAPHLVVDLYSTLFEKND